MTDKLTDLKNKLTKLEMENKNLQEKFTALVIEIVELSNQVYTTSKASKVKTLIDSLDLLQSEIDKILNQIKETKKEIERLQ